MSMSNLNWVDYVILAIFFFSILGGFFRGFIRELVSLVTLVIAFIVASVFANPLAIAFTKVAMHQAADQASASAVEPTTAAIGISFALIFAATIIVGAIIGFLLNLIFKTGGIGFGNRLLGTIFGFCRAFIVVLVIIFVVQLTAFADESWWHDSQLVAASQPAIAWMGEHVSPALANIKEKLSNTLNGSSKAP